MTQEFIDKLIERISDKVAEKVAEQLIKQNWFQTPKKPDYGVAVMYGVQVGPYTGEPYETITTIADSSNKK